MRIVLTALLLGTCGYAPPAYFTHVGAPGSLSPEQGSIQVASGYATVNVAQGELTGTIPLPEGVRLELGTGVAGADGSSIGWALGRAGLRYGDRIGRDAAYDVELGGAGGVGGTSDSHGPPDPYRVYDRPAGGAYIGGGLAHWIDEHAVFVRIRTQVGFAATAPVTFWGSAVAGVDLDLEALRLHLAGGGYLVAGEQYDLWLWLVEGGITIPIGDEGDVTRRSAEPPSR